MQPALPAGMYHDSERLNPCSGQGTINVRVNPEVSSLSPHWRPEYDFPPLISGISF